MQKIWGLQYDCGNYDDYDYNYDDDDDDDDDDSRGSDDDYYDINGDSASHGSRAR